MPDALSKTIPIWHVSVGDGLQLMTGVLSSIELSRNDIVEKTTVENGMKHISRHL